MHGGVILVMEVIRENLVNMRRIWSMAKLTVKEEFRHAKLGIFWEVLRTAVFFSIYALFYFVISKKTSSTHVFEIFSVLLPFNLVIAVINQTPRIYSRNKILVNTIKFPLGIMPTFDIVAKYIIHLVTLVVILVLYSIMGHISFTFIQIIYYYICLFVLLNSMMFTLSMVCSISDDAYKFWQVVTRIFIYINPVFWSMNQIENKQIFSFIARLNPFAYILEGFRQIMGSSKNYDDFAHNHLHLFNYYTLYFWGITFAIFMIGILFQTKLRKILPDIL